MTDSTRESDLPTPALGRRSLLRMAAFAAAAGPILGEAELAHAKLASQMMGVLPPDAVIINANENPLPPARRPARPSPRSRRLAGAMTAWASSMR